jgi:hypothetical protein
MQLKEAPEPMHFYEQPRAEAEADRYYDLVQYACDLVMEAARLTND